MECNRSLGITSGICLAGPRKSDIELSVKLENYLREAGMFETDIEMNHRFQVLGKLNKLVKEWIKEVTISKKFPPQIAEAVGGKIFTFGSYRLGVAAKGADIDALCVAPRHIDRVDYFTSFYELLKLQPEVKEIRAVEDAFVPVIKMKYEGIEIDMLFARLDLKMVPDNVNLNNDQILKNLDEKCVRSLNGCRVTDEILRQVPRRETFRLALRAVKLWAKSNGVYSNVLGYLGGVSWAMLVARTCQLYPNAVAATLVEKFFLIFSKWAWPVPVYLKNPEDANLGFKFWDSKSNVTERFHLMPIITPTYPQQNSTFNASASTRNIITEAFKGGLEISKDIMAGKSSWERLFTPSNFFGKYRHFLVTIAVAKSPEDYLEWHGLVESKIRHLITTLEQNPAIKTIHINPNSFTTQDREYRLKPHAAWFIGFDFNRAENINIDLTKDINKFVEQVYVHSTYNKGYKEGMEVNCKYVKRKQLPQYLSQEILNRYRSSEEAEGSCKGKSDVSLHIALSSSSDVKKLKTYESTDAKNSDGNDSLVSNSSEQICHTSPSVVISDVTQLPPRINYEPNNLSHENVQTQSQHEAPNTYNNSPSAELCNCSHSHDSFQSHVSCITSSTSSHHSPLIHPYTVSPHEYCNYNTGFMQYPASPLLITSPCNCYASPCNKGLSLPHPSYHQSIEPQLPVGCGFSGYACDLPPEPHHPLSDQMYEPVLFNGNPMSPQHKDNLRSYSHQIPYVTVSVYPQPIPHDQHMYDNPLYFGYHPHLPMNAASPMQFLTPPIMQRAPFPPQPGSSYSHIKTKRRFASPNMNLSMSPVSSNGSSLSISFLSQSSPRHGTKRSSSQLKLSYDSSFSSVQSLHNNSSEAIRIKPLKNSNRKTQNSAENPKAQDSHHHKQTRTSSHACQKQRKNNNKPPALVIARQRLSSREIPDVLTPDTPKFASPKKNLLLNLK